MRSSQFMNCIGAVFHLWLFTVLRAASLPNVALSGTASQSATAHGGAAGRAIDGNTNPVYSQGSCTHTPQQKNPWWSLLLPGVYRVEAVTVTNRLGAYHRINGAEILIGNSAENNGNNNPRCAVISHIPGGQDRTFQCGGMEGRLVNVYLPGTAETLTLCEVQVYAEFIPPPPSISAAVGGRDMVLVGKKLCWSDALFYCRDFYWDLLTLQSREEQGEAEELLSDASFPLTSRVWLGLRRHLLGTTWFWMSGDPMTYSHWEEHISDLQYNSPCGSMAAGDRFLWEDHRCDEHLHFICLTGPQEGVDRVYFFSTYRKERQHLE